LYLAPSFHHVASFGKVSFADTPFLEVDSQIWRVHLSAAVGINKTHRKQAQA
jgi:hypothetical protein